MIAIYVFWIRQVKKYLRSPARVFGSLGQPILFLISLGFGLSGAVGQVGDVSYLDYLVPGIVGLTVLFSSMFSGIELISDRRFGFLRETLVAPVRRVWIFLGMALGGATISTMQGILVLLISLLFGFSPASFMGILGGIGIMFLVALLFTMIGLSLATRLRDFQSFPLIINFIIFPLFFLSGAIFPLDSIPPALAVVTRLNPLTYGVDLLRSLMIGQAFMPEWIGITVILGLLGVFVLLGNRLFNRLTI